MSEVIWTGTLALTVLVLALLVPFALHRSFLLILSRRTIAGFPQISAEAALPKVTVQLPIYNELHVVARLIDAAAQVDYPAHLLEIQVLDDSTDATVERTAMRVKHWADRGVNIRQIRRDDRKGFKAGALAAGLQEAAGEFLLVLDADFVMPRSLIRQLLPPFQDEEIGAVQARWDYLNRDESWLTRAQAMLLDGHFFFEQGGRYAGGRFFNFNGTAGMWRRSCIEDAGGWSADTLTEDLDLSYRAQLAGWRFAYLGEVGVPSEIPGRVGALEVQQKRWAQGGIQTARKVLPRLLRSALPLKVKAEAVIHLLGHMAHPLTVMLSILLFPSALARARLGLEEYLFLDILIFSMATGPFLLFYGSAGRRRGLPPLRLVTDVLSTLLVGIGLSVPVSRAVRRGWGNAEDPFLRTPKAGSVLRVVYRRDSAWLDSFGKLALGSLMIVYLFAAIRAEFFGSIPFIILFGAGYLSLGWAGLRVPGRMSELEGIQSDKAPDGDPDEETGPDGLFPEPSPLVST